MSVLLWSPFGLGGRKNVGLCQSDEPVVPESTGGTGFFDGIGRQRLSRLR